MHTYKHTYMAKMEYVGVRAVTSNSKGNSLNYVQSGFSRKFNVLMKGNMAYGTSKNSALVLLPCIYRSCA